MNDSRGSDARSLDVIQKLVARQLVDRAVLLGEARWPGSGPLIRLAAAWPELPQDERAARLEEIGPEALSRLRSVAELQPELASVLANLSALGVMPPGAPLDSSVQASAPATDVEDVIMSPPSPADEELSVVPSNAAASEDTVDVETTSGPAEPEVPATGVRLRARDEAAVAEAAAMLERIHARVQQSIDRAAAVGYVEAAPAPAATAATAAIGAGTALLDDVLSRPVTTGVAVARLPELRRAAEAAGLEYVVLDAARLARGELYGRMVRTGLGVATEAGALPRAASRPALIAFVGRLLPRLVERIGEGYCDIPGTNATVRVHPRCRVVVVDR